MLPDERRRVRRRRLLDYRITSMPLLKLASGVAHKVPNDLTPLARNEWSGCPHRQNK
jgi:hypothetical protein